MKKLVFIIMLIGLVISFNNPALSQSNNRELSVSIDSAGSSTASTYIYQVFSNRTLSGTQISPSNQTPLSSDFTGFITIDSLKAVSCPRDSFRHRIYRMDEDGSPYGAPYYVDYSTNLLTTVETWNNYTFSNKSTSDIETLWFDARGDIEDWGGVVHLFDNRTHTVSDSVKVTLYVRNIKPAR